MGSLHLSLLGTPKVRHIGEVLTFPTRKTLALLVYLVVEKGLHSREKLTAFFWPESDVARGRAPLRNTLGHLRTTLREASTEAQPQGTIQQTHLIVERDALSFDFTSDFDLDISTLETTFTLVRSASAVQEVRGDTRRHLLAQLQYATSLHRGSFLEGFSLGDAPDFDTWASMQREVCYRRLSMLFNRLSHLQFESGEMAEAIDTTARWVAHDPLSEAAYQRLMRLHFAAGNRETALRAYETCRLTLAQELHAQPTPETRALAERIRTTAPPRHHVPHGPHSSPPPPSSALEGPLPFVGRVSEYVTLVESYSRASRGQMQVVILEGEAGIGKTRLANEFLGWATAQGADVLRGQAFEAGGLLPYSPLVEALRPRLERENAPDDLLSDTWLTELSRLLPELRDRYPDLPSPTVDEAIARTRLFEAFARLGQVLAERAQLVVFIDDLHWADAASLDLLYYTSRCWRERGSHLLLLVSMRSEALLTSPPLMDWVSGLAHDLAPTRLTLESLSFDATLQLVQSLAKERPADAQSSSLISLHAHEHLKAKDTESQGHSVEQFGRWLFAETKGQPFFIVETLRALLERGVLIPHPKEAGIWMFDVVNATRDETKLQSLLPSSVREMIRTRLLRLSPAAFGLLAAAAILEQGSSFERLCQVAGSGENEGLSALDELLRSRLLSESLSKEGRRAEGTYFFTHDKIREVVYTEAGEARRKVFHRRAFDALQAAGARSAQLAYHAFNARLQEPSFHFSLEAGDDAMQLFAVRDAIAQYEQAQQILKEWTEEQNWQQMHFPVADVHRLYIQLGRAYELSSDITRAQVVYEAMLTFAREVHEPAIECAALNRLATLAAWKSFDMDTAAKLLQEALRLAENSGERAGLAETEWNLAQMNFYAFRAQEARLHAERALALARELDLKDLIARSLNVLAYSNMRLGNLKEVAVYAEEAHTFYAALRNRAMEADCLSILAMARCHLGLPHGAIEAARAALTISREIENASGQVFSGINLGIGSREIGAYGEALAIIQQAANMARSLGFLSNLIPVLILSGVVQGTVFAVHPSRTTLLEAAAFNEEVKSQPYTESIAAVLCMDCSLAGEWEEAHDYARQSLAARDYLWSYVWHFTLWYETEALLRGGDVEQAEENVHRFGESMKDNRRYRIAYLRAQAVLAHWRDEDRQAITHLQEAVALAEEIGLPGERWQILAELGKLYRRQGNENQAHLAFAVATEIVQCLADTLEDEQQRTMFLSAQQVRSVLESASPGE